MKYLGIDYGAKKIGLALSDENGTMGFPHSIVPNTPRVLEHVCALMAKENTSAVVIGDSKNFKGGDNAVAPAARSLGDEISARCGVPVFYESETLTSAEARRAPHKAEKTRSPKATANVDSSAAALILTSYLSRNHG